MRELYGCLPLGSGLPPAFHIRTDLSGDGGDTEIRQKGQGTRDKGKDSHKGGDICMNKGSLLPIKENVSKALTGFLKKCLENKIFEAVFVPVRLNNGFNYMLIQDTGLLEKAEIMPPVMPVQGGKAVLSLTRHGKSRKIAAVLRPCEIRAAVELSKMQQTDLENIFLISLDCYGVVPLSDYLEDKTKKPVDKESDLRPLCRLCENFSLPGEENSQIVDLFFGSYGVPEENVLVIPESTDGEEVLKSLGMETKADIKDWSAKVTSLKKNRSKARKKTLAELKEKVSGLDGLTEAFSRCMECYNCRSVCPICYCRLCFVEKGTTTDTAENYLLRAEAKGAMRILPEPLLFHLGRMAHMSLSCVSCGMCEDVCPVDIPVGQIFSLVSAETRAIFDYLPGRNPEEELPYKRFELEELTEVEDR